MSPFIRHTLQRLGWKKTFFLIFVVGACVGGGAFWGASSFLGSSGKSAAGTSREANADTPERWSAQSSNRTAADNQNLTQTANPPAYIPDEMQNISVYENCNEAVVNISTQIMAVNWFLEPVPQEGGTGSGSIIDRRGYVVTNTHVIADAYKIYITLSDGTQYEGTVVGTDSASDIAVLKFSPPAGIALKTIPYGDSSKLKVGQKVLAIGNPFGFDRTLTTGIVSGLGRPIQSSRNTIIRNMIQTDTAINPGNSGGPLLDTAGNMIGINTMIYSTSGSSSGVGFAVPIDTAQRVVADLIAYGTVRRGTINGLFVQLNTSIAEYAKLEVAQGLLVSELSKGSQAARSGLKPGTEAVRYGSSRNARVIYLGGDIITEIESIKITSLADFYSVLESKRPGDEVTVVVLRGNKRVPLTVRLEEAEKS
ncbi:MAG: trypsin-like peptidase domain-containing protein [Treponemataceae bacterium]|nr:MAG: trypsin-like peptidase domain-containing protein [Treponemataceae bacterium]